MFIELMRGFSNAVLKMFWGENGENLVATLTMVALMFAVTFAYHAIIKRINQIRTNNNDSNMVHRRNRCE